MTEERAAQVRRVLELVEDGMAEAAACREVGINRATFRAAALKVSSGDSYARALEALAQDQVEKAEQVIEDMRNGVIDAQQARVELDARKWFASKFLPKRYGDKAEVEHSGNVGLTVNVVRLTDAGNKPAG
jgi:hypothetical protein